MSGHMPELCCQCDSPTGRAGRADDSLYIESDWGPYCTDCWGDAEYWRRIADENISERDRLKTINAELLNELELISDTLGTRKLPFAHGELEDVIINSRIAIAKGKEEGQ